MRLNFRNWCESKDIYGFTEPEPIKKVEDELPIQPFATMHLMDQLSLSKIGNYQVLRKFTDQVQWGTTDGAIRVKLTPNQHVIIERLTSDLQGQPIWITKKLFQIKIKEYTSHEDSVARDIAKQVEDIAYEQIDSPQRNFNKLYELTKKIASQVKVKTINMFHFEEIKKISETNYNILFSLVGGVGKIVHSGGAKFTPAGIIDVSYDENRGVIKSFLTTIDIENEGGAWQLDLPYFSGEFVSSQPMDEIVKIITSGLKFV